MSFEPSAFALPGNLLDSELAPGLRPLTWHGLCAQITALQDLRRAMAGNSGLPDDLPTGSFDGGTARLIATGFSTGISGALAQIAVCKHGVNPNSSANGKAIFGKPEDAMNGVWTGRAEARD